MSRSTISTSKPVWASLYTRDASGLQAWPDDHTTIQVPARAKVETYIHPQTKDAGIYVEGPKRQDDIRLYIPRGGSVVIEAV